MTHTQVTVTTTATLLFSGTGHVRLKPQTGSCYIGGSNAVTSGDGQFLTGDPVELHLTAPAEIWAITSSSTADVRVLSWY